ncbi:MAG: signal peptide peptidase SppA [Treponema sp.]|nr:signal peptide peptidase SppA [Treponema sp.]
MRLNGKVWIIGACLIMAAPKLATLFSQNIFLELNLNSQAVQGMIRSVRPRPALEIFRVIERAGNDRRVGGIILNVASYNAGQETLWELRNALEKFKSRGKKICAFISGADLDLYCLATVADRIVMDGQGVLTLLGYTWGRGYVRGSLEKLGIGVRELRYLEYKSANEMFTRDSLSDADRVQYGEILDDIMALARDTVTKARSWNPGEFDSILNDEFMFSAKSALERGLVDRTGRKDAVIEALKEISGLEKIENFFIYGDSETSLSGSGFAYKPARAGNLLYRPPVIAVIYANGVTDMERGIAAWSLASAIREASQKRRVKAIVLRINSPGGSAEAADYVAEAVKFAKKRVPVVVSMGAVAASGGYWASMSASHIVASPVTVTGSIGVIGSWFYDNGLNGRLGLTVDSLQRGSHADMQSGIILPRRDLREEEEARYRDFILDMYADFTAKVAENRGMDIERVESAAQGRVFSGTGALKAGLIDSIGGLDDAVSTARALAKIPGGKKTAFREYPKPKFLDRMMDRVLSSKVSGGGRAALFEAASLAAGLFLPVEFLEEFRYRVANNGRVMPVLPIGGGFY